MTIRAINSIFLMIILIFFIILQSSYIVYSFPSGFSSDPYRSQLPQLWLTISAQTRTIEISWINARLAMGDKIFITNAEPKEFQKVRISDYPDLSNGFEFNISYNSENDTSTSLSNNNNNSNSNDDNDDGSGSNNDSSYGIIPIIFDNNKNNKNEKWECNKGKIDILEIINPFEPSQWIRTSLKFDYNSSENITKFTKCYGYWASYVNKEGEIISTGCIKAYPMWMNEMRTAIGQFRIRDLFIPGSHDSGAYRKNFKPSKRETIVTKYALTQDDDIRGQLMHGIRYLDIRVGYYKNTPEQFFVNHGITKQRPLNEVLSQIREFILETNEIIIVDVQEFPVGFGKDLTIHRKLVQYMYAFLKDLLISPQISWQATLSEIWGRKQNIFLSYDHLGVVSEFSNILFPACEQRWGNVKKWSDLENYLRRVNTFDMWRLSSRPVSDMAELTPEAWGVITDKYGGLRKMADQVNWRVSRLYREDLGQTANIVSVDFYRGTTIVDLAIYFNYKKVIL
ncbi:PI-PLC X domain-containing protein 1 [Condylostylus longicornis]|uniref:PI-PLC X domain-containing protein 1 n=1 Tax=Condylostylus longicornis TaxID=2530218 RepID=UPI00244E55A3|nr:PI-PLC X domain-containing protein 1 [Condylostylus longicornis]